MRLPPSMRYSIVLVLLILSFTPASEAFNTIPPPNNTFSTGLKTTYLVDKNRLDPFAPSPQPRAIAISAFYPISGSQQCCLTETPYMPPASAAFEGQEFAAAFGIPNSTFSDLRLSVCGGHTAAHHPIVLFSPGLGASRFVYNILAQAVASAGYIVITIDHPYDADVIEFPGGRLVFGVNITDDLIDLAVDTRAKDASFVLDQLSIPARAAVILPLSKGTSVNTSHVGFFGHSLGGATAAATMFNDTRVVGGLDMDGSVYGPVVSGGLDRPFLLFGRQDHGRFNDSTWTAFWPNLRGERFELSLNQSEHLTFSDLPYLVDFLGFRDHLLPGLDAVIAPLDSKRGFEIVSTYVVNFLDLVIKGRKVQGLQEPDPAFPEVSIVP